MRKQDYRKRVQASSSGTFISLDDMRCLATLTAEYALCIQKKIELGDWKDSDPNNERGAAN